MLGAGGELGGVRLMSRASLDAAVGRSQQQPHFLRPFLAPIRLRPFLGPYFLRRPAQNQCDGDTHCGADARHPACRA